MPGHLSARYSFCIFYSYGEGLSGCHFEADMEFIYAQYKPTNVLSKIQGRINVMYIFQPGASDDTLYIKHKKVLFSEKLVVEGIVF